MNGFIKITGEVEDVIYRNDSNGFTVIDLQCENETVTAVGTMPYVNSGETLMLTGSYTKHPSYGDRFAVSVCERHMPESTGAVLKYLSSGAIKGIGPKVAAQLVNQFGENTLDVIKNEPQRVAKLKGISAEKAESFSKQIKEIFGLGEVMSFLSKYGITPPECVKIWRMLGSECVGIIKGNPYIICSPGLDLSFERADMIASEDEFFKDSDYRIKAAAIHILTHNKNNGHTCLPLDKLTEITADFISAEKERVSNIIKEMINDRSLCLDTLKDRDFIFLPSLYEAETYCAARLKLLLRYPANAVQGIDDEITEIEINDNIRYADLQKQAIKMALSEGLLILTGGPGTGKTTTLNAIIKILQKNGEKVFLAAPTGRAAHRMSELTNCEAKTIHRLLEVCWSDDDKPYFKRNEKNQLSCDALVLDELSMIDSQLFESVMRALPMGCRLIMVGDSDQLPSVGAGNVLGDLVSSGVVPVVQLKEIFRQSMQSLIVTNAHRIVNGEMPLLDVKDSDFFFMYRGAPQQISDTITELYKTRLPVSYGYSPLSDIQVIAPSKKGELGTIELNKKLQMAINPPDSSKKEINIMGKIFREGDKVMQMRNNYNILWTRDNGESGEGVFNGDVGILTQVNKSNLSVKVRFDNRTAVFEAESIADLDLAYAVTVHKSQGNEFEAVIMPMYRGAPQLSYRNLLYTAVTRAKKLLILVGNQGAVEAMVENNRRTLRYSGLKEFITR